MFAIWISGSPIRCVRARRLYIGDARQRRRIGALQSPGGRERLDERRHGTRVSHLEPVGVFHLLAPHLERGEHEVALLDPGAARRIDGRQHRLGQILDRGWDTWIQARLAADTVLSPSDRYVLRASGRSGAPRNAGSSSGKPLGHLDTPSGLTEPHCRITTPGTGSRGPFQCAVESPDRGTAKATSTFFSFDASAALPPAAMTTYWRPSLPM